MESNRELYLGIWVWAANGLPKLSLVLLISSESPFGKLRNRTSDGTNVGRIHTSKLLSLGFKHSNFTHLNPYLKRFNCSYILYPILNFILKINFVIRL